MPCPQLSYLVGTCLGYKQRKCIKHKRSLALINTPDYTVKKSKNLNHIHVSFMDCIKMLLWVGVAEVEISNAHSHLVLLSFLGLLEGGTLRPLQVVKVNKMFIVLPCPCYTNVYWEGERLDKLNSLVPKSQGQHMLFWTGWRRLSMSPADLLLWEGYSPWLGL